MKNKLASLIFVLSSAVAAYASPIIGFDVNSLPGGAGAFGASPFAPTTTDPGVSATAGLTRGAGVGTTGTAAARGWGGVDWQTASGSAAVTGGDTATFSFSVASGFSLSLSTMDLSYRRSGTGPANGVLQYSLGGVGGTFTDITTLSYASTSSSGATLSGIDLTGVSALQNIAAGTDVAFRFANYGGTSSSGTWYVYDVANSTASDLVLNGTLVAVPEPSTYAMLVGGLGVVLLVNRSRKRLAA